MYEGKREGACVSRGSAIVIVSNSVPIVANREALLRIVYQVSIY